MRRSAPTERLLYKLGLEGLGPRVQYSLNKGSCEVRTCGVCVWGDEMRTPISGDEPDETAGLVLMFVQLQRKRVSEQKGASWIER